MANENHYTPREWYELWNVARDRYVEREDNYFTAKNEITKQLILAQDEKFKESRAKAARIEQKKRDRVKQKKQQIEDHYKDYIRNALAEERAEKLKRPIKRVTLVGSNALPNIHSTHYRGSLEITDSSVESPRRASISVGTEVEEGTEVVGNSPRRSMYTPDLRPEE